MTEIAKNTQEWVEGVIKKADDKMNKVAKRLDGTMPFISIHGSYDDRSQNAVHAWTNGFIGGIFWMMYVLTDKKQYREMAERNELQLDGAFRAYEKLDHDVGFMWIPTSGIRYKLFGEYESKIRMLRAADILAGRFNLKGEFIRAWNQNGSFKPDGIYSIIDSMMNISLLYWASEEIGDPRYKFIAETHANTTIKEHIREDGSVIHIAAHDKETAELITTIAGQGYSRDSAWSRGQAWAIYGFIISYIHTKNEKYLNIAKITANYFILSIQDDFLPRCDFRSPEEPVYYDASAGAIAACGLLELAKYCDEFDGIKYKKVAIKMLHALEENFCDWTDAEDAILTHSSRKYADGPDLMKGHNVPLIWGDYFFLEAIAKLKDEAFMIW